MNGQERLAAATRLSKALVERLTGVEAYKFQMRRSGDEKEARAVGVQQVIMPLSERDTRARLVGGDPDGINIPYFLADLSTLMVGTLGTITFAAHGDFKIAGVLAAGKVMYNIGAHAIPETANKIRKIPPLEPNAAQITPVEVFSANHMPHAPLRDQHR